MLTVFWNITFADFAFICFCDIRFTLFNDAFCWMTFLSLLLDEFTFWIFCWFTLLSLLLGMLIPLFWILHFADVRPTFWMYFAEVDLFLGIICWCQVPLFEYCILLDLTFLSLLLGYWITFGILHFFNI